MGCLINKVKGKRLFFIFLAIAVVIVFVLLSESVCEKGMDPDIVHLDHHWTVKACDSIYEIQTLSDFKLTKNFKGVDSIVYTKEIQKDFGESPFLRFNLRNTGVRVYLGDSLLYENGVDLVKKKKLVPSALHTMELPEKSNGKLLKISVITDESEKGNPLTSVEIIHMPYLQDHFSRHFFSLGVGVFLVSLGFISVVMGLVAFAFFTRVYRVILIGLMAFFLGVWILGYMKIGQLFSMDFTVNTIFEYISLYIMPVLLGLLLVHMRKGSLNPIKWKGLIALLTLSIAFFVVTTILQFTGVARYSSFLSLFHIFLGLSFLFLSLSGILYDRHAGIADKFFAASLVSFCLFGILDLIRYNLHKYFALNDSIFDVTWFPIGSLVYVLLLFVSYFIYLYNVVMDATEKDVLSQIAYRDALTGLYNRAKCEQIFEVLNNIKNDYAIISIDMNGLKKTNDTFGHSEGDRLIVTFAQVFRLAFSGVATVVRMGGDEFVAIVRDEHLGDINASVKKMLLLEKEKSVGLPVSLNVSYGIAYRRNAEMVSAMDVYRSADEMMYQMKVEFKKSTSA